MAASAGKGGDENRNSAVVGLRFRFFGFACDAQPLDGAARLRGFGAVFVSDVVELLITRVSVSPQEIHCRSSMEDVIIKAQEYLLYI